MEDKRMEVLSQYDLTIRSCVPARGALLLETDRGSKILRSCSTGIQRLQFEDTIKKTLRENGIVHVDTVVPTSEGKLFSENTYGEHFCVRDWFCGDECNLKKESQCLLAVENLARLHLAGRGADDSEQNANYLQPDLRSVFEKRTRELKRVRSYIRAKKQKSEFEVVYLRIADWYFDQALQACALMDDLARRRETTVNKDICHGSYTYHNLILLEDNTFATTSFDRACYGLPVTDLYYFLRKTLEKNDWSIRLGQTMLHVYDEIVRLDDLDFETLRVELLYPEKFWKITNYYYNNRKSWIPQKNLQKMFSNHDREDAKATFIRSLM